MSDPYRIPSPPIQEKEKRSMFPKKVPTFAYIFGCASFLGGGGLAGEYLSRGLPEGHASVSSVFVVLAALTMALYFGIRGAVAMANEKKPEQK